MASPSDAFSIEIGATRGVSGAMEMYRPEKGDEPNALIAFSEKDKVFPRLT
jgi:hypothetical protein